MANDTPLATPPQPPAVAPAADPAAQPPVAAAPAPAPAAPPAAAPAPAPADAAPEGNPPVVDGIIRLRDANRVLHDYPINAFSEAKAKEVYTLLPTHWQKKIDAQAAFFQNYQRTITGIPEELRAPGELEKFLKKIHEQGGYLSEETSPAVRQWLDGPDTAGLRSSGLFKGYKAASAIAEVLEGAGNFLGDLPSAYYDGLMLPVRGLLYAGNVATTELSKMAAITPEQAKSMATAYQGMMYMATESEFAPKETKTSAPGTVGNIGGSIQSGFNYVMVAGIAAWNFVVGWVTGEKLTWAESWTKAEDYWTEGKGLKNGEEAARDNATRESLEKVRPVIEAQLRQTTIDGMDITPYLTLNKGDIIADRNGNVASFNGQDVAPTPVMGPDGETPLKASEIEKDNLQSIPGGLFQDLSPSGVAASVAGGVIAPALTYKGAAEGYARTKILGEKPGVEKAHAAAKVKLETAKDAYRTFKTAAEKGELKNLRGQPLSDEKINAKGQKLWDARVKAYKAFEELDVKLNGLPEDPIADAKQSSSWGQRQLGKLAEAGVKQLPENADIGDKIIHRLKAFGRWPGAAAAHVSGWTPNFARGLASGAADAISPDERGPSVKPLFGDKAKEGAKAIRELGEVEPTTKMGGFGKFVGKWGTGLAAVGTFASPIVGFSTSEDTAGAATYAASGAGLAGATFVAGGKKFGLKALSVGVRRIVPGAGLAMDSVDYLDGARTDNAQKKRDAAVSAATQGFGAFIGGGIGGLVGFFGGFGIGAAPAAIAGATLGTTVAGFASMATVPLANRLWPVKIEPKALEAPRATPAPQIAAVGNMPQPGMSNDQTVAALMAQNQLLMQQLQMTTGRAGSSQVAFNANAFSGLQTGAGGAFVPPSGGGQRPPQPVRLNLGV